MLQSILRKIGHSLLLAGGELAQSHFIWTFEVHDANGNLKQKVTQRNLIPSVAKAAFAKQMAGTNTQQIGQNLYIALGTNSTTPAVGDTTLGTEVLRKIVGLPLDSGATATLKAFFNQTEATGTYREFGLFGNGASAVASVTANTGVMFSKLPTNVAVGPTETLTVTITYTFI